MPRIRELMTTDVLTVEASEPVRVAMRTMLEADIRHVPVLDGGELVGILSDRDLREFEISIWDDTDAVDRMREHRDQAVSSFMKSDLLTCTGEDDVGEAIALMLEHKVGAVPVVKVGTLELAGILSYVDVLRAAQEAL